MFPKLGLHRVHPRILSGVIFLYTRTDVQPRGWHPRAAEIPEEFFPGKFARSNFRFSVGKISKIYDKNILKIPRKLLYL